MLVSSILCLFIVGLWRATVGQTTHPVVPAGGHHPSWLVNYPHAFQEGENSHHMGALVDKRGDVALQNRSKEHLDYFLRHVGAATDGEMIDAIEHFFWGMWGGLAMELGALDGTDDTQSMTYELEAEYEWNRILVEGNPHYRTLLPLKSPKAFGASAAICPRDGGQVHYVLSQYVGGILEFMSPSFMQRNHPSIFYHLKPPGNASSIDFEALQKITGSSVIQIDCVRLDSVLHRARVRHVNLFILDVEGGELEVLKSIDWDLITFDILCIETDEEQRPAGYAATIGAFLSERGYGTAEGAAQQRGRNTWYAHKNFVPSVRPGFNTKCYNGVERSAHELGRMEERSLECCPNGQYRGFVEE